MEDAFQENRSEEPTTTDDHLDWLQQGPPAAHPRTFFPSRNQLFALIEQFGPALYVHDEATLDAAIEDIGQLEGPFGTTIRFAMKANPNRAILQKFDQAGWQIDASSAEEAERAIYAGIDPQKILLTTQEIPEKAQWENLLNRGVKFTASSLEQLEAYGRLSSRPNTVSIRINPGEGSGGSKGTNVGGAKSGFGIWHEDISKIQEILSRYDLEVVRVHTHIGSGSDPNVWREVTRKSIALLEHFPTATILDLGGGFRTNRLAEEDKPEFDFRGFSPEVTSLLSEFHTQTGRAIHLELEPGTRAVAHSGALIATVQDVTDTPDAHFAKLNIGMGHLLRPAMYGAKHPLQIHHLNTEVEHPNVRTWVTGHCCESSDLVTPEAIAFPRADRGDVVVVGATGAYCEAMRTLHYNSFKDIPTVMIRRDGRLQLIRKPNPRNWNLEENLST